MIKWIFTKFSNTCRIVIPSLLIDRVVEVVPGKSIHAYKNVTINEPFFVGHFPHHPVMLGVLIMEALAQAAGILSFKTEDKKPTQSDVFYFAGIDDARFKRPVMPGDQSASACRNRAPDARRLEIQGRGARSTANWRPRLALMCAKRDL